MDFSQHTVAQWKERLQQLAAAHSLNAQESHAAQTADWNETTMRIQQLNDRFDRYVAIREAPAGSGHYAVVDIQPGAFP